MPSFFIHNLSNKVHLAFEVREALYSNISFNFRFKNIKTNDPTGWSSDQTLIKATVLILLLTISYIYTWVLLNALIENANLLVVYNYCLNGQEAEDKNFIWTLIFIGVPVLTLVLGTAYMDLRSLVQIRHMAEHRQIDKIPLKATIISTSLIMPYLAYIGTVGNFFQIRMSPEDKFFAILIPSTIINIVRNPVIVGCAFQVNPTNRIRNSRRDRELKRQKEIHDAIEFRRLSRMEMTTKEVTKSPQASFV